jgi:hypothetical protein
VQAHFWVGYSYGISDVIVWVIGVDWIVIDWINTQGETNKIGIDWGIGAIAQEVNSSKLISTTLVVSSMISCVVFRFQ